MLTQLFQSSISALRLQALSLSNIPKSYPSLKHFVLFMKTVYETLAETQENRILSLSVNFKLVFECPLNFLECKPLYNSQM